ncbi:MAG TPA: TonB-dependent receptor [Pyrinomonadaceae bacterium]|nr:TonB-dependent receptor [Pyrinomonadaceae bacterium]
MKFTAGPKLRVVSVCALLFAAFLPGACFQSVRAANDFQPSGRIRGTVLAASGDRKERLPGAIATLNGAQLGDRPLETVSDELGQYSFNHLPAGEYKLTVTHTGFQTVEHRVTVAIDATVDLDVSLEPSHVEATVNVSPAEDRIDTNNTTVSSKLSARKLQDVPLINEKFQDALPLLPGVMRSSDGALNIKGTRPDQSGVLVSSMNVTDPVTGDAAIDLPLEAVESVQVFSNPFSSEYGRFTGAVTAIETRSGTNDWRYLLTNVIVRPRFRDSHIYGVQSATPRIAVGGPLKKDKAFLFQSFEYRFVRTEVTSLPPAQRDSKLESFDSFTRVDVNLNSTNRLAVSFSLFPEKRDAANLNTFTPLHTAANIHQRGWFVAANDQKTFAKRALLQSSFNLKQFDVDVFGNSAASFVISPQRRSGGWFNQQERNSRRLQWLETLSLPERKFHGIHEMRLGFDLSHTWFDGTDQSSPVRVVRADGTLSELITFVGAGQLQRDNTELAAFGQDSWHISPRLTIDLGLRWDRDGIGSDHNFAPRVGFAWMPFANDHTVIRGGVGVFYDKIPIMVGIFEQYQQRVVTTFASNGVSIVDGPRIFRHVLSGDGYRNPYSGAATLQIDHEIKRVLLRVGYEERQTRRDFILEPQVDGRLLLRNDGQSRYRELQVTGRLRLQERHHVYVAYVRSRATGDLNAFNDYFGNLRNPLIRANERSLQPFDAPNRLLAWGDIALPKQITVSPVIDWHTGFPFSLVDENQNFVGARNRGGRYPSFFSLDLQVTKGLAPRMPNWGFIPAKFRGRKVPGRFGVKVFNLTNHWNPRDFQNNVDANDFGTFYNSPHRGIRLKFEFVKY